MEAFSRRKKKSPSRAFGAGSDVPTRAADKSVNKFIKTHGVDQVSRLKLHYSKPKPSKLEGDGDVHDAESLKVKVLQDWECLKTDVTSGDIGIELVKNETHSVLWPSAGRTASPGIPFHYCSF